MSHYLFLLCSTPSLGLVWLLWARHIGWCLATSVVAEAVSHSMGPIFIDEPPSRTHFSNTTGAVITCSATSSVVPVKVWWVLADGQSVVSDITGLRYVRPNGQLVFPPFALNQYRQDIHSTVSCAAIANLLSLRAYASNRTLLPSRIHFFFLSWHFFCFKSPRLNAENMACWFACAQGITEHG